MSAFEGKADMGWCSAYVCFSPKADITRALPTPACYALLYSATLIH